MKKSTAYYLLLAVTVIVIALLYFPTKHVLDVYAIEVIKEKANESRVIILEKR
jgi:hypothetical protein